MKHKTPETLNIFVLFFYFVKLYEWSSSFQIPNFTSLNITLPLWNSLFNMLSLYWTACWLVPISKTRCSIRLRLVMKPSCAVHNGGFTPVSRLRPAPNSPRGPFRSFRRRSTGSRVSFRVMLPPTFSPVLQKRINFLWLGKYWWYLSSSCSH